MELLVFHEAQDGGSEQFAHFDTVIVEVPGRTYAIPSLLESNINRASGRCKGMFLIIQPQRRWTA